MTINWANIRAASAILSVIACLSVPQGARAETLAETLVSAYNNSGLLEQNRALLRAADENVAQAIAALRPIIGWSANATRNFGRSNNNITGTTIGSAGTSADLGVSMELLLYDFGQSPLRQKIAQESVLGTRESLVAVEQNVLSRAVAAHMEVRRQSEFVALRQSNTRLITQELRAARDRFEVGEVTRTDVSLAEARLAAARSGLAAAQGALMQAREEYRAAVGHMPDQLAPPPRIPATPQSADAAKRIALRAHPEMLRVQHDVTAAELSVELANAGMNPRISLTARYGLNETFDSPNYSRSGSVGVGVSGPIYQGGNLSSLLRQSMAQRDAVRANLHVVQGQIAQQVGNAFARLQVARASIAAGEGQVAASEVAFRGVREEATLGARTTLDVLNAEQELLDARATLISAVADEQVAAYTLLAAMGQLTAEKLQLNVQRYDPAAYYEQVKSAPNIHSSQGRKLDRVLRAIGKQ